MAPKKRPGKGIFEKPAAAPSFGRMDELDTALVRVPPGPVSMPGSQNESDEAEQGEEEEPLDDDAEDEDGNEDRGMRCDMSCICLSNITFLYRVFAQYH